MVWSLSGTGNLARTNYAAIYVHSQKITLRKENKDVREMLQRDQWRIASYRATDQWRIASYRATELLGSSSLQDGKTLASDEVRL